MTYPYKPKEKIDVHTHTTLSPNTYESLDSFSGYHQFVRVRAHANKSCCAEMVKREKDAQGNIIDVVQRVIENNSYDADVRERECEGHGVTRQVITPTPMNIPDFIKNKKDATKALTICKILNNDNADLVEKHPEKFVALGALPMMHADKAVKELERIKALGMRGFEVNSNIENIDLGDPRFFPIFEAAADMNLAVFVHPWGGFMNPKDPKLKARMNEKQRWKPWMIGMAIETTMAFESLHGEGVHERLPHLRVLYAHGGGAIAATMGTQEHGRYCRPDLFKGAPKLSTFETVQKCGVYVDSRTHNPDFLKYLVNLIGANRIAMGSDYPYPLGELDPFDPKTGYDAVRNNQCPYPQTKGIYPGHMIEHLPRTQADMEEAKKHFNWLPLENKDLPCLLDEQKEMMLSGTAK